MVRRITLALALMIAVVATVATSARTRDGRQAAFDHHGGTVMSHMGSGRANLVPLW